MLVLPKKIDAEFRVPRIERNAKTNSSTVIQPSKDLTVDTAMSYADFADLQAGLVPENVLSVEKNEIEEDHTTTAWDRRNTVKRQSRQLAKAVLGNYEALTHQINRDARVNNKPLQHALLDAIRPSEYAATIPTLNAIVTRAKADAEQKLETPELHALAAVLRQIYAGQPLVIAAGTTELPPVAGADAPQRQIADEIPNVEPLLTAYANLERDRADARLLTGPDDDLAPVATVARKVEDFRAMLRDSERSAEMGNEEHDPIARRGSNSGVSMTDRQAVIRDITNMARDRQIDLVAATAELLGNGVYQKVDATTRLNTIAWLTDPATEDNANGDREKIAKALRTYYGLEPNEPLIINPVHFINKVTDVAFSMANPDGNPANKPTNDQLIAALEISIGSPKQSLISHPQRQRLMLAILDIPAGGTIPMKHAALATAIRKTYKIGQAAIQNLKEAGVSKVPVDLPNPMTSTIYKIATTTYFDPQSNPVRQASETFLTSVMSDLFIAEEAQALKNRFGAADYPLAAIKAILVANPPEFHAQIIDLLEQKRAEALKNNQRAEKSNIPLTDDQQITVQMANNYIRALMRGQILGRGEPKLTEIAERIVNSPLDIAAFEGQKLSVISQIRDIETFREPGAAFYAYTHENDRVSPYLAPYIVPLKADRSGQQVKAISRLTENRLIADSFIEIIKNPNPSHLLELAYKQKIAADNCAQRGWSPDSALTIAPETWQAKSLEVLQTFARDYLANAETQGTVIQHEALNRLFKVYTDYNAPTWKSAGMTTGMSAAAWNQYRDRKVEEQLTAEKTELETRLHLQTMTIRIIEGSIASERALEEEIKPKADAIIAKIAIAENNKATAAADQAEVHQIQIDNLNDELKALRAPITALREERAVYFAKADQLPQLKLDQANTQQALRTIANNPIAAKDRIDAAKKQVQASAQMLWVVEKGEINPNMPDFKPLFYPGRENDKDLPEAVRVNKNAEYLAATMRKDLAFMGQLANLRGRLIVTPSSQKEADVIAAAINVASRELHNVLETRQSVESNENNNEKSYNTIESAPNKTWEQVYEGYPTLAAMLNGTPRAKTADKEPVVKKRRNYTTNTNLETTSRGTGYEAISKFRNIGIAAAPNMDATTATKKIVDEFRPSAILINRLKGSAEDIQRVAQLTDRPLKVVMEPTKNGTNYAIAQNVNLVDKSDAIIAIVNQSDGRIAMGATVAHLIDYANRSGKLAGVYNQNGEIIAANLAVNLGKQISMTSFGYSQNDANLKTMLDAAKVTIATGRYPTDLDLTTLLTIDPATRKVSVRMQKDGDPLGALLVTHAAKTTIEAKIDGKTVRTNALDKIYDLQQDLADPTKSTKVPYQRQDIALEVALKVTAEQEKKLQYLRSESEFDGAERNVESQGTVAILQTIRESEEAIKQMETAANSAFQTHYARYMADASVSDRLQNANEILATSENSMTLLRLDRSNDKRNDSEANKAFIDNLTAEMATALAVKQSIEAEARAYAASKVEASNEGSAIAAAKSSVATARATIDNRKIQAKSARTYDFRTFMKMTPAERAAGNVIYVPPTHKLYANARLPTQIVDVKVPFEARPSTEASNVIKADALATHIANEVRRDPTYLLNALDYTQASIAAENTEISKVLRNTLNVVERHRDEIEKLAVTSDDPAKKANYQTMAKFIASELTATNKDTLGLSVNPTRQDQEQRAYAV